MPSTRPRSPMPRTHGRITAAPGSGWKVTAGLLAAAVAVPDDESVPHGPLGGQGEPAAEPDAAHGGVGHAVDPDSVALLLDRAEDRACVDRAGPRAAVLPEGVEPVGGGRGGDAQRASGASYP